MTSIPVSPVTIKKVDVRHYPVEPDQTVISSPVRVSLKLVYLIKPFLPAVPLSDIDLVTRRKGHDHGIGSMWRRVPTV